MLLSQLGAHLHLGALSNPICNADRRTGGCTLPLRSLCTRRLRSWFRQLQGVHMQRDRVRTATTMLFSQLGLDPPAFVPEQNFLHHHVRHQANGIWCNVHSMHSARRARAKRADKNVHSDVSCQQACTVLDELCCTSVAPQFATQWVGKRACASHRSLKFLR